MGTVGRSSDVSGKTEQTVVSLVAFLSPYPCCFLSYNWMCIWCILLRLYIIDQHKLVHNFEVEKSSKLFLSKLIRICKVSQNTSEYNTSYDEAVKVQILLQGFILFVVC